MDNFYINLKKIKKYSIIENKSMKNLKNGQQFQKIKKSREILIIKKNKKEKIRENSYFKKILFFKWLWQCTCIVSFS